MYERFIAYTNQVELHWLLMIDDQSGRIIRWRLNLAKFDFVVKYKKCHANTQADEFSWLNSMSKMIPHDDKDNIPVLDLEIVNTTW